MLNKKSKRGRIIKSALTLAERQGWRKTTLAEIAEEAGVSLSGIHRRFGSKTAILEAFIREVDDAMLRQAKPADMDTPARDRLFEVIMGRFDILEPYKGALARIYREYRCAAPGPGTFRLLCASAASHEWMLVAAGVPPTGPRGCARVSGLMCLYARVVPVWLNDDDDDMGKTMAALDRELRSGERWLKRIDTVVCDLARIACCFVPRRRKAEPGPAPEPGSAPRGNGQAMEQPGG
jgi:AcrR family transcriptional regulator